jgi:protein subunit release factor B
MPMWVKVLLRMFRRWPSSGGFVEHGLGQRDGHLGGVPWPGDADGEAAA